MRAKRISILLAILGVLFFTACKTIPKAPPNRYIATFEVRKSAIPNAGNGVFATQKVPANTDIGGYIGEYISEEKWQELAASEKWHYVIQMPECAYQYVSPNTMIDGINGNIHTRINYAPAEFQNVKYEYFCEEPFVRLVTLREIQPGEELYTDYGDKYTYFFMDDPAVKKFFADLRKKKLSEARKK